MFSGITLFEMMYKYVLQASSVISTCAAASLPPSSLILQPQSSKTLSLHQPYNETAIANAWLGPPYHLEAKVRVSITIWANGKKPYPLFTQNIMTSFTEVRSTVSRMGDASKVLKGETIISDPVEVKLITRYQRQKITLEFFLFALDAIRSKVIEHWPVEIESADLVVGGLFGG